MGIPQVFPQLAEADTPAEMRAALEDGRYSHPSIQHILDAGRKAGLSEGDLYASMAYFAFQSLIQSQREYARLVMLMPSIAPAPVDPAAALE